jgi:hypothetical protein
VATVLVLCSAWRRLGVSGELTAGDGRAPERPGGRWGGRRHIRTQYTSEAREGSAHRARAWPARRVITTHTSVRGALWPVRSCPRGSPFTLWPPCALGLARDDLDSTGASSQVSGQNLEQDAGVKMLGKWEREFVTLRCSRKVHILEKFQSIWTSFECSSFTTA